MSTRSYLIAGRVRSRRHGGVGGVRVQLYGTDAKRLLAESLTNEDGEYRTRIPVDQLRDVVKQVVVRVVDGANRTVGRTRPRRLRGAAGSVLDVLVADNTAARAKPLARPLERVEGGLIDPVARETVAQAIDLLAEPGTPMHNRLTRASQCPAPPIDVLETLVPDAWEVLDGHPAAAERFRRTMQLFAPELDQRREARLSDAMSMEPLAWMGGFGGQAAQPMSAAGNGLPTPGITEPCALTPERLAPVMGAALLSARNVPEARRLVASLERGLCGIDRFQLMLDAAHRTLATGDGGHLGGVLNRFAGECGPDDGPLPPIPEPPGPGCPPYPPLPDPERCFLPRLHCLRELIEALQHFPMGSATSYNIVTVTPDVACPGDTITVRGGNFGSVPGAVCFTSGSTGVRQCVTATRWSETEVMAVVPNGADAGEVSLSIVEDVIRACERTLTIYRRGNSVPFDGGSATINRLSVNGGGANVTVEPDSDARIRWSASAGATVRIRVTRGGSTVLDQSGLPSVGSVTYHTPSTNSDQRYVVTATATSRCGTATRTLDFIVTVIPVLEVAGIEVTQGNQRFWRTGIVPNSLPTIANKDTIARVYVTCDRRGHNNDRIANVTGTLRAGGVTLNPINGITPTNPGGSNPFITARRRADIDRTQTNHTLNFRIPANLCQGTQTLRVAVAVTFAPSAGTVTAIRNQNHTWQTNNALRVRFVRVRDDNAGNGTNTRPTAAQCTFTVQRAFDLLPSPPTDIGPAWRATWNTTRDITTNGGLQGLLNDLDDEHNCSAWEWMWAWTGLTECPDDDNAEWVGLTAPFNRGWATGGNTCVSALYQDAQGQGAIRRIKTAHELGHNLGFCHDSQGCGSNPAGACTTKGTLEDVPFDPYWNQAIAGNVWDLMSYGCTRWTDDSSWNTLISNI